MYRVQVYEALRADGSAQLRWRLGILPSAGADTTWGPWYAGAWTRSDRVEHYEWQRVEQAAWTFGLISLGPLAAAAFHPNPKGLEVMGKAIAAEVGTRLR